MLARSSAARLARVARTAPAPSARALVQRSPFSSSSSSSSSSSRASQQWAFRITAAASASLVAFAALQTLSPLHCDAPRPTQASKVKGGNQSDLPDISHLDQSLINDTNAPMRNRMETFIKFLQYDIVSALSNEEPKARFLIDSWLRKEGGEGISCVLQDGETFEKAGVNISVVHGNLPPAAIRQMSADHAGLLEKTGYRLEGADPQVKGLPFYAAGLSLVVHPRNPFAPTVHFNYRYFELTHPETLADGSPNPRYSTEPVAWWFGGGTDLTPIYLFDADARHFHGVLKGAADAHDANFYPTWKRWCDRYFWIPHRGEARGVGGIFFDDLTLPQWAKSGSSFIPLSDGRAGTASTARQHNIESLFHTVRSLGNAFLPAYLPILQRRKDTPFTPDHERWQHLRRGRYVEFNLVYDRGTKFGLQTPGARIESILMSLPLRARWEYMEKYGGGGAQGRDGKATLAAAGSLPEAEAKTAEEKKIQDVLRNPRDWA